MGKVRRKLLRRAALLVVFLVYLFGRARDSHDGHIRESAVDFSTLRDRTNLASWLPHKAVRSYNGTHIDDRYEKLDNRALDSGKQGFVQIYIDTAAEMNISVVVKVISAPSRNDIPPTLLPAFQAFTATWPSEIEAALALGPRTSKGQYAFVPVHDYFILQDATSGPKGWSWAIVTELIAGGTLVDLAQDVRKSNKLTADQVDLRYRASLDRLLSNLRWLHQDGYCHDDVKPKNIFARTPDQWLLGDLGNTRDAKHVWHETRLWRRRNKSYVPTCQADDIRRTLKSYMFFLRAASYNRAEFDWNFLSGKPSWARLYWSLISDDLPADDAIAASEQHMATSTETTAANYVGSRIFDLARRIWTDSELKPNSNLFKLWILP